MTTRASATNPSSSEGLAGVAALDHWASVVERGTACDLPGCSIKYDNFMQCMWKTVAKGDLAQWKATWCANGLQNGFSLGIDESKMHGHRWFRNYKSALEAPVANFHYFGENTCGVFFKVLKDRKAAQCQLALGFWWDSRTLTRCLVQEKVDAYMFAFGEVLTCKTLSLLDMQKTAGKMRRAVMTFPTGAACLVVSMFALMCGLRLPWHRRRAPRTVRRDVRTVIELLKLNLGKGYYSFKDFALGPAVATACAWRRGI